MKKIITLFCLIGIIIPIFSQIPGYVPSNGLAAWWSFTGNANDESGNNNNGSVLNAVLSPDRFGNQNAAYYFNGTNAKISISSQTNLNLNNSVSISAWINPQLMQGQIVFRGDYQSGKDPYFLHIRDSSVYFQKYVNTGLTPCYAKFDTTLLIPNVYNHIVGTYDSLLSRYRIYLNGVLMDEQIMTGSINYTTATMSNYIGGINDNTQRFKGYIDDIGIWNRELNKDEITLLYEGCQNSITLSSLLLFQYIGSDCVISATNTYTNSSIYWQTNIVDFGWLNVPENNTYTGADSIVLTVNNIQPYNFNQEFRAIANYYGCIDTSDVAIINIIDTLFETIHETVVDTSYLTIIDTTYLTIIDTLILSYCDTMIINTPLSITPFQFNEIKIYPNPTSTFIYIDFGNYVLMTNYRLKIMNSLGQVVYESMINQQLSYIDLSSWSGNGLYLVQIVNPLNNIVETRKIILQ